MKLTKYCPWCGRRYSYIRRSSGELSTRTIVYKCGTQVSDYPACVQVGTPCTLKKYRQWVKPKRWAKILQRSRKDRLDA